MDNNKPVQILMSTFNGRSFLQEQFDSLVQQTYLPLQILARDDGSTDGTYNLMSELIASEPGRFMGSTLIQGQNLGVIGSFYSLLEHSDPNSSYFAFCDQDDVWDKDKLWRAVKFLDQVPSDIPAIYCSTTELVDNQLQHLKYWPKPSSKGPSFANALIENVVVGCTLVFNNAARNLILSRSPNLSRIIMHDWWFYLCVSAFGQVIFDLEPMIKYRQHHANVIGGNHRFWTRKINQVTKYIRSKNHFRYRQQNEEFYRLYGDKLSAENKNIIEGLLKEDTTFYTRVPIVLNTKFYRHSRFEDVVFKLLFLLKGI